MDCEIDFFDDMLEHRRSQNRLKPSIEESHMVEYLR
jgi:hypothetical protein